jgi:hypothetical protein
MMRLAPLAALALVACAVPTTGIVPRADGMFTVTQQGGGAWVQTSQLTATASQEAAGHCQRLGKAFKLIHTKEIPAGPFGRWPESEILFRCE